MPNKSTIDTTTPDQNTNNSVDLPTDAIITHIYDIGMVVIEEEGNKKLEQLVDESKQDIIQEVAKFSTGDIVVNKENPSSIRKVCRTRLNKNNVDYQFTTVKLDENAIINNELCYRAVKRGVPVSVPYWYNESLYNIYDPLQK